MVGFRTVRRRGLLAGDLHSGAWVLRVHTEVDVRTEAHAERVGRHLNAFDDRRASTIEKHDLKRGQHIRIGEQIPSRAAGSLVVAVRQVRR